MRSNDVNKPKKHTFHFFLMYVRVRGGMKIKFSSLFSDFYRFKEYFVYITFKKYLGSQLAQGPNWDTVL